jgi:hypothetical protein
MPRAPLVLALLALAAQPAWPETLTPGKPAGTEAAQHISYGTGFIGLSIIAVALVFALPSSSTSSTDTSTATTS